MSVKKQIVYSGLTKKIYLARAKKDSNGFTVQVGNDREEVSETALQCAAMLVRDEGGEVSWDLGNGKRLVLSAYEESLVDA